MGSLKQENESEVGRVAIDKMMQQDRDAAIAALESAGAKVERSGDNTSVEASAEQIGVAKTQMGANA